MINGKKIQQNHSIHFNRSQFFSIRGSSLVVYEMYVVCKTLIKLHFYYMYIHTITPVVLHRICPIIDCMPYGL